jgi:hypothetical protein
MHRLLSFDVRVAYVLAFFACNGTKDGSFVFLQMIFRASERASRRSDIIFNREISSDREYKKT